MAKENVSVCVMTVEFNTFIKTEWINDKDVNFMSSAGLFTLKLDCNRMFLNFTFYRKMSKECERCILELPHD